MMTYRQRYFRHDILHTLVVDVSSCNIWKHLLCVDLIFLSLLSWKRNGSRLRLLSWNVAPCSQINIYWRFGVNFCLHLQDINLPYRGEKWYGYRDKEDRDQVGGPQRTNRNKESDKNILNCVTSFHRHQYSYFFAHDSVSFSPCIRITFHSTPVQHLSSEHGSNNSSEILVLLIFSSLFIF